MPTSEIRHTTQKSNLTVSQQRSIIPVIQIPAQLRTPHPIPNHHIHMVPCTPTHNSPSPRACALHPPVSSITKSHVADSKRWRSWEKIHISRLEVSSLQIAWMAWQASFVVPCHVRLSCAVRVYLCFVLGARMEGGWVLWTFEFFGRGVFWLGGDVWVMGLECGG
ncbi:hypothetical protein EYC80_007751 [Monilinia laxa]|uniref:Uncharacterized protein n=1 Tax=Monilinia laxa TaxID=61186 RepID=A0A5N6JWW2_MONLA|nr:hypothetical protein EYC80_007751 [Monilinia laxa]